MAKQKQMFKKLVTGLATGAIVFCVTGSAMATSVFYESDDVVDMNVPNLQYDFTFETLQTPTSSTGGTLFLHHSDGEFALENESVGVFIDDVYYGSLFHDSNSDADTETISLDWHQMYSITSDGEATVRLVNSSTVGDSSVHMTEVGTMSATLAYDGTGLPGTGSSPTPFDGSSVAFLTDDVEDINHPNMEYVFQFDDLLDPAYMREGLLSQPLGGTLFLQHTDGEFALENESIAVYIDDVYFGSLFHESNSDGEMEAISLDWHQLYSVTEDGEATVRIVNSLYVGDSGVGMNEYGTMSAVLTYHTPVPEPTTMLLFGTGLAGLVGLRLRRKKK